MPASATSLVTFAVCCWWLQNLRFVDGFQNRRAPAQAPVRNGRMAREDEPNVWGELPAACLPSHVTLCAIAHARCRMLDAWARACWLQWI